MTLSMDSFSISTPQHTVGAATRGSGLFPISDSLFPPCQNPTGINLTSTLDALGNRLVLQDNYGVTSYTWDVQSRLVGILNPYNEATTMQWDALDREYHRVLANGCTASHTWDVAGRETLLENRNAAAVGLSIFTNTYSAVDNRLTVAELDGTLVTYGYDATSQLISEARSGANAYNISYVYDGNKNRLTEYSSGAATQYLYNAANEQILITPPTGAPTTQTFDAVGNLILQNTGGALTTQTWDGENRLTLRRRWTPPQQKRQRHAHRLHSG